MPRFFIKKEQIDEHSLYIEGDDARHIARALRMAVGDEITVSDGEGYEYAVQLTRIRDDRCDADIKERKESKCEPKSKITVFMAYPKGDKLETVIQKAVELGAYRIVPFESSRCIKRPDAEKSAKRNERLERIAHEAAKQCGRASLPSVTLPISYNEMIEEAKKIDLPIFCYEGDGVRSLKAILEEYKDVPRSIAVIVGSEGGFSESEAIEAQNAGLKMANLGPRILRCETAPDYVLSCISYFFEL